MTSLRTRTWDPKKDTEDSLWGRLSEGWRDLVSLFQLLPAGRSQLHTLDFVPSATLSFEVPGINTRPDGVSLVSLYRVDTGASSGIALSWTYDQDMISTTSFSGLAATTWRATFLVIGAAQ